MKQKVRGKGVNKAENGVQPTAPHVVKGVNKKGYFPDAGNKNW